MDWAMARGIPWGFLSCGFQFDIGVDSSRLESLKPWIPYLQQAHFVTVRSPVCLRIVEELSGRGDGRFFPDAAYLYRPTAGPITADGLKTVVIVPAARVNAEDRLIRHFIRLFESVGHRVVWLGMGAKPDDQPLLDAVARMQPGVFAISCRSPVEAHGHIARSQFVITGRYHGMVFARSCGIPFFVPEHTQHKIRHEDLTVDPAGAIGHIETLQAVLRQ
jgi:polysaccharide pyruvyl transferase WcaK-like protein